MGCTADILFTPRCSPRAREFPRSGRATGRQSFPVFGFRPIFLYKTPITYLPLTSLQPRGYIAEWLRFLPRDAVHKRGLCCHAVSVRLSVTFVDQVKTNKRIFEIFSPSGSGTILVFLYQRWCRYSDGTPLTGASNARGYDKMTIFSQISRSISETVIVRWAYAASNL